MPPPGAPLTAYLSPPPQQTTQASHRSFMSRASSASRATTRAGGPGGAVKVDRVKRYQQLAAEWGSNRWGRGG